MRNIGSSILVICQRWSAIFTSLLVRYYFGSPLASGQRTSGPKKRTSHVCQLHMFFVFKLFEKRKKIVKTVPISLHNHILLYPAMCNSLPYTIKRNSFCVQPCVAGSQIPPHATPYCTTYVPAMCDKLLDTITCNSFCIEACVTSFRTAGPINLVISRHG